MYTESQKPWDEHVTQQLYSWVWAPENRKQIIEDTPLAYSKHHYSQWPNHWKSRFSPTHEHINKMWHAAGMGNLDCQLLMMFRVTMETRLWTCQWGSVYNGVTAMVYPTLAVGNSCRGCSLTVDTMKAAGYNRETIKQSSSCLLHHDSLHPTTMDLNKPPFVVFCFVFVKYFVTATRNT